MTMRDENAARPLVEEGRREAEYEQRHRTRYLRSMTVQILIGMFMAFWLGLFAHNLDGVTVFIVGLGLLWYGISLGRYSITSRPLSRTDERPIRL